MSLGEQMTCTVVATPSFARVAKKLHAKDKGVLDEAVKAVAQAPLLGEEKRMTSTTFAVIGKITTLAFVAK